MCQFVGVFDCQEMKVRFEAVWHSPTMKLIKFIEATVCLKTGKMFQQKLLCYS
jgi:hypothetical protein